MDSPIVVKPMIIILNNISLHEAFVANDCAVFPDTVEGHNAVSIKEDDFGKPLHVECNVAYQSPTRPTKFNDLKTFFRYEPTRTIYLCDLRKYVSTPYAKQLY